MTGSAEAGAGFGFIQPTSSVGQASHLSLSFPWKWESVQNFVKYGVVSREMGELYDKLFDTRQKGDYADLVRFNLDKDLIDGGDKE